ncbi:MAG: hypothetical protein GC161_10860 [Planctomycetaceae bacterium]|nr:hypothetical protein [Planctomycetaceae bacterium]
MGTGLALVLLLAPPQGAPPPHFDTEAALRRGAALLVERQEDLSDPKSSEPAEWPYEGVYRERGAIPPGYRVGGTAIGALALLLTAPPDDADAAEVHEALRRALNFVLREVDGKDLTAAFRGSYDVRGWGQAYALEFLLRWRNSAKPDDPQRQTVDRTIQDLIVRLESTALAASGGWNYARAQGPQSPASPFMTAPILLALFDARAQGFAVDTDVVEAALDGLAKGRAEVGAFAYTSRPSADAWQGAIGRSPVAELALYLGGRGDAARIEFALERFFEHWEWLEKRRRGTGTHVPPYGVAPYYFFYAHAYAGICIEHLDEERRAPLRRQLLERLAEVREPSGGWNDRVFPRSESFGTAMAMWAMVAPDLPPRAAWVKAPTIPTRDS